MPRSPNFYFGTVIFFLGVLLMAFGVSNITTETLNLLTFVELGVGVVLIIVGSRAVRTVPK
jgi:uncharacterized membrane protein